MNTTDRESAADSGKAGRMSTIAIVDDDPYIGDMLERVLRAEGYLVLRAYSGTEALLLVAQNRPDLILLDLMLPGLSGEEVLPQLAGIPVIVLSAKVETADKVNALLTGAWDYMTKPFEVRELLARITAQLRRQEAVSVRGRISCGGLLLDTELHQVWYGDEGIRLTKTEFAILKLLMENAKQVIPRSVMLERISADTPDCVESSLKVHISNLRKKLRAASGKDFIEAVWGIGFKLHTDDG